MNVWIVVLAVAGGSYALRVSMFLVLGARELPRWAHGPIAFVGPAAIGALTASVALVHDGRAHALPWVELVAIGAGFVAVRRSGSVMHAFTVGLPVFWLATLVSHA